jgi:hypothetical protein
MLWISNLTGIIKAFSGQPIFKITLCRITLSLGIEAGLNYSDQTTGLKHILMGKFECITKCSKLVKYHMSKNIVELSSRRRIYII